MLLIFGWIPIASTAPKQNPQPGTHSIPFYECFTKVGQEYNIDPHWLVAVAIVESSLDPTAVSTANALGLMQIKWPITAKHLGITNREILFEPCASIEAGARYLVEVSTPYRSLNNEKRIDQMLAAYRMGPNAIKGLPELPTAAVDYIKKVRTNKRLIDARVDSLSNKGLSELPTAAVDYIKKVRTNKPLVDARVDSLSNRCSLPEFKLLSMKTHHPFARSKMAIAWINRNRVACDTQRLVRLINELPSWIGTSTSNPELQKTLHSLSPQQKGLQ